MKRFLLFLILCGTMVPALAVAQSEAVTLSVRVGLGGVVKQSAWTPAVFTLANTGPDLQGVIEWRWNGDTQIFAQTVDLPRGSHKQIILPIRASNFTGNAIARFLVNNKLIAQQPVPIDIIGSGQPILAVVGDEAQAVVGILGAHRQASLLRSIQMATEDIPDRPELLDAVNWLLLSGDTSGLRPEQQAALRSWVDGGGHLVINGARPWTAQGLGDFAPAAVQGPAETISLADLRPPNEINHAGEVGLLHLVTRAGSTIQLAAKGSQTIIVQHKHGAGTVLQFAVDVANLGATPAELSQLLGVNNLRVGQPANFALLEQALRLPALRLPSLAALLAFLLCYIILVGPINYLFLRRWDRREWAYITIPLTVALFTLAAYAWGTAVRGSGLIVKELAIIRSLSGAATGQGVTEVGIYSPDRRTYTLGFPPDVLVGQSLSGFRRTASGPLRTLRTETAVEVPGVLLDVGALQSFTAAQATAVPQIQATRTGGPNGSVLVRNTSNQTLEDVVVVQDRSAVRLGNLPPGGEQRVPLPLNDFIASVNVQSQGLIDRRVVLMTMITNVPFPKGGPATFPAQAPPALPAVPQRPLRPYPLPIRPYPLPSSRQPVAGIPPPPIQPYPVPGGTLGQNAPAAHLSVYAWLPTSQMPVQVDGHPATTQGETLLIVGVDDAPDR